MDTDTADTVDTAVGMSRSMPGARARRKARVRAILTNNSVNTNNPTSTSSATTTASINPRVFRRELMRLVRLKKGSWAADQFAIGEQHDAQEFMNFLLDGLSEDLSWTIVKKSVTDTAVDTGGVMDAIGLIGGVEESGTITGSGAGADVAVAIEGNEAETTTNPTNPTNPIKSGYIEQPDSNDAEYSVYKDPQSKEGNSTMDKVLADIWWGNHFQKEISVIQTLFLGQYKSKMYCQVCNYNSCRYETFNSLSLSIPKLELGTCRGTDGSPVVLTTGTRGLLLHVAPMGGHKVIRCFVELSVDATVGCLIDALLNLNVPELSQSGGASGSMLQVAECVKNRVCALYMPSKSIDQIKQHACLYVFELACRYTYKQWSGFVDVDAGVGNERSQPIDELSTVIHSRQLSTSPNPTPTPIAPTDTDTTAATGSGTTTPTTAHCTDTTPTPTSNSIKKSSNLDSLLENADDGSLAGISGDTIPDSGSPIPPVPRVPDESLVRVVFTHRRVKLVSIYNNIEKYAIESFGTPIMLVCA